MNWYYSESMNRPNETDTTSSKVYNYVRRNIEEVTVDGETKYTWEECKIPKENWELYLQNEQQAADIDYLMMLTEDL